MPPNTFSLTVLLVPETTCQTWWSILSVTRRPAKGGHVLLFEVLSSVRQALALYGKMSGFSQSLTCPHCWLQWHNIISIVYTDLISIYPVLSYFVTCSLQVLFDLLQVLFDYLNLNKRQMENLTLTRRLLFVLLSKALSFLIFVVLLWVCRYLATLSILPHCPPLNATFPFLTALVIYSSISHYWIFC